MRAGAFGFSHLAHHQPQDAEGRPDADAARAGGGAARHRARPDGCRRRLPGNGLRLEHARPRDRVRHAPPRGGGHAAGRVVFSLTAAARPHRGLEGTAGAVRHGGRRRACRSARSFPPRPIGILLGPERQPEPVLRLRRPTRRSRICRSPSAPPPCATRRCARASCRRTASSGSHLPADHAACGFDRMFPFGDPPDYAPPQRGLDRRHRRARGPQRRRRSPTTC